MHDLLDNFSTSSQSAEKLRNEQEAYRYLTGERKLSEKILRQEGVSWVSHHSEPACRFTVYTPLANACGARLRLLRGGIKYMAEPGTPQIISHLHRLKAEVKHIIWCEGDVDRLSLLEAGCENVLSCPGHAIGQRDTPRYLMNRDVMNAYLNRRSVIATDNDATGDDLAEHIARIAQPAVRLRFPAGIKDANQFLQQRGREALHQLVDEKLATFPEQFTRSDDPTLLIRMKELWERGHCPGYTTGCQELDQCFMWAAGLLVVVTGHAASGKTTFLDWLLSRAYEVHGWRTVFASFEQPTEVHALKLAGLTADLALFNKDRPEFRQVEQALHEVRDRFVFVDYTDTKDQPALSHVLARIEETVTATGAKLAVIDPWNGLAPDGYIAEHLFITSALTMIRQFAQRLGIVMIVTAHPCKPKHYRGAEYVLGGYDISGSGAWFSKADVGITVHRPSKSGTTTEIYCWKLRWDYLAMARPAGQKAVFDYEVESGRYIPAYNDAVAEILEDMEIEDL